MSRKAIDLTGKRFGRLVAIRPTDERDSDGSVIWKCKCDCGNITYAKTGHLKNGYIKSCGCLQKENRMLITATESKILKYNINKNNTSGHKGISYSKENHKYKAYICFHNVIYYLLYSNNINDCIAVRKEAESAVANGTFEQWIADYKGRRY